MNSHYILAGNKLDWTWLGDASKTNAELGTGGYNDSSGRGWVVFLIRNRRETCVEERWEEVEETMLQ